MDFSLKLKQETKLALTQEMRTSMNILQMSSSKLNEFLEKEIITNPAIEINYSTNSSFKTSSSDEGVSPMDFITKEETLVDYLEEQLGFLKISNKLRGICDYIINNLDNRGYLIISKLEIKKSLNISMLQLNEAFKIIHSLEPLGIGAENLKDCLKIQLRAKDIEDPLLFLLIDNFLEELAGQNFEDIAKELNITPKKVEDYLEIIRTLSPIPARGFLVDSSSNYIIPEATIEIINGEISFKINEDNIPKVTLNQAYTLGDNPNKNSIYLALNIIKSIEKRYQTLNKILEILIKRQKEYFFKGENFLKTLTLKDIAKELDLHESTISRAVKDKYIETPQGIISMKALFILDSTTIEIKNIIENLIESENKKTPLSDEKISHILESKGFSTARRTVTKYREELGYPSTRERKRKNLY